MKIGLMIPTKSRPIRLKVLFDSFKVHQHNDTEFVVGIDKDQLELYAWVKDFPEIRVIVTNGEDYVAKANYMVKRMKKYQYIYLLGDDFVFNCEWEQFFLDNAFPNCVMYGRDSLANSKLCTAAFMDNNIFKKIGYVAPPTLVHYFADNVWRDIGQSLGTYRYFDNMNIQHLHKNRDPKYMDQVYVDSDKFFPADKEAYEIYAKDQLLKDISKILS